MNNLINLDPALLKVRDALRRQHDWEKRAPERIAAMQALRGAIRQHYNLWWDRPEPIVENISLALNAYSDERGTSRPSHVKWGRWNSIYDDDTDTDVVVAFELSAHFPKGAWRERYRLPRISREMSGFTENLHHLEKRQLNGAKV